MSRHFRQLPAILIVAAAFGVSGAVRAADAPAASPPAAGPPPAAPAAIDALLAQLSHDDWKLREKAQHELSRFGPEAVPRLKALLAETKDPELRTRAEGVLKQIEENDATGPTFVTLRLKDAAPALAFDDLVRQAGAKLETQPPALLQREDLPRVTINAERQPFWDVMRQLCATCKVRPDRSGGGKLVLVADDGSWGKRPCVTSGPFLVTANELYVTRGVRFGADPPAEPPPANDAAPAPAPPGPGGAPAELIERLRIRRAGVFPQEAVANHAQLQLSALFEPKLQGMAWSVASVAEATDDAGRSLLLTRGTPQRRATYGGARTGEWESTVWLDAPPNNRPNLRVARLKVVTNFTVRSGVETLEVPDIMTAKEVERIAGPTRVVIRGVTRFANDQYELSVATYPVGDPKMWQAVHAGQAGGGPRLLDADGRPLTSAGGSSSTSANEHTSQLRFSGGPGPAGANGRTPAKLVWDLPTGVRQFQVPVEFEDLPMP